MGRSTQHSSDQHASNQLRRTLSNIAHKNPYQIEQELNPAYDPNRDPSRQESNKYAAAEESTPSYDPNLDPARAESNPYVIERRKENFNE